MILILSQNTLEYTTEAVMDWLERLGADYLRLNGEDIDGDQPLAIMVADDVFQLQFEDQKLILRSEEIEAVWFRRWQYYQRHEHVELFRDMTRDDAIRLSMEMMRQLNYELNRFSHYLFSLFDEAEWLSHPTTARVSKLQVLKEAISTGLDTPATLVTNSRHELLQFMGEHGSVITKAIGEAEMYPIGDEVFMMYTAEVSSVLAESLPDRFFPSLFQEKLDKAYELRVFYLAGTCYTMAIFSQSDRQTRADFRQYNHSRPNRYVPYNLPEQVEDKIRLLMRRLDLETGSLDLIKTLDGRYVFLEVNPIGQFGMVSRPCNYFLERRVAECLIAKARHGKATRLLRTPDARSAGTLTDQLPAHSIHAA